MGPSTSSSLRIPTIRALPSSIPGFGRDLNGAGCGTGTSWDVGRGTWEPNDEREGLTLGFQAAHDAAPSAVGGPCGPWTISWDPIMRPCDVKISMLMQGPTLGSPLEPFLKI
jgi:hypothetical protein